MSHFDRRHTLITLFLSAASLPVIAHAQGVPDSANVVTTCGTPNNTYPTGQNRPITQDNTGTLCTVSGGGGAGGNVTVVGGNLTSVGSITGNVTLGAGTNNIGIATIAPSATVVCAALCANLTISGSASHLAAFEVSADSTLSGAAWWVMIFNATAAPADGNVTPAKCYALPSGATAISAAFSTPVTFGTGITVGVSTTGCFTKTQSVHALISGDTQ